MIFRGQEPVCHTVRRMVHQTNIIKVIIPIQFYPKGIYFLLIKESLLSKIDLFPEFFNTKIGKNVG